MHTDNINLLINNLLFEMAKAKLEIKSLEEFYYQESYKIINKLTDITNKLHNNSNKLLHDYQSTLKNTFTIGD